MDSLIQDIRFGARTLRKSPGFALVAALTLALGIGANSAIFSVINAVLLKPMPFKNADRLVMIWHNYPELNLPKAVICVPCYQEYRDQTTSFENVATGSTWNVNLTGEGEPERLTGAKVSWNYFDTLGVDPAPGRSFSADEDQPGRSNVVVISHGLWQRRFGGASDAIGQTVILDGTGYQIVGVLPRGFVFLQDVDVFTPSAFTPAQLDPANHGNEAQIAIATIKPGVSLADARAEMDALADKLRPQFYGPNAKWGLTLTPVREELLGDLRGPLFLLFGAVACVLLIACVNVASLLLVRGAARQKEISVRVALGADRLRIVRQLLTESLLLAVVGAGGGVLVAYGSIKLLLLGVPQQSTKPIVGWNQVGLSGWVLLFTFAVALITGIAFGLIPSLQASKPDLNETLKEGSRGSSGRHRVRSVLVVAEVAISMMLLVGAGLLIRSFAKLLEVNPGFRPDHVTTMQLSLPPSKYREKAQVANFFTEALEQIRGNAGVEAAGFVDNIPMGGNNSTASFAVEGLQIGPGEPAPHGDVHVASSGYFQAMGIALRSGRFFSEQDSMDSVPVAMVDETLAEQYFPAQDPIGKRIAAFFESKPNQPYWRSIVGVVGNVKQYGLEGKRKKVQYYFPATQRPSPFMFLAVRATAAESALVPSLIAAIRQIDKDQPIFQVRTMETVVSNSVADQRFVTSLLGTFAGLALILAVIGIYGVTSYSVTQRTREIGIRMALGAARTDVMKLVMKQGVGLTLTGVAIGIAATIVVTRILAGVVADLLFGIHAGDPLTFAAVTAVLIAAALAACLVPARRATRVDPLAALHYE